MPELIKYSQLQSMNEMELSTLDANELVAFSERALFTVNSLYERLNQSSENSSKPSSSDDPWKEPSHSSTSATELVNQASQQHNRADVRAKREQGYGRHQKLEVNHVAHLQPIECSHCGCHAAMTNQKCYTGFYQIDLEKREGEGNYYHVVQTKYLLYDATCGACSGVTRSTLAKTEQDGVEMSRRTLIGPQLASALIRMHKENGTSIGQIKATLEDFYGITLSKGAICTAINHGGICCEDQVEMYRQEAEQASLAHMDETTWKHCGKTVWLWIVVTVTTCLVMMGRRTKQMALSFLNGRFNGWLMSDGYRAYRDYKKRFRCWAHLLRKCKGLSESQLPEVAQFGERLLSLLSTCMTAIYSARELSDTSSLSDQLTDEVDKIKQLCLENKDSDHSKTRKLAREFLNDWEAIFRILDYPDFPLTNNEAERAIRHWVILRKVLIGTQSEKGKRATCAIASMIGTGKRRAENFIQTIKNCIQDKMSVITHLSYTKIIRSG